MPIKPGETIIDSHTPQGASKPVVTYLNPETGKTRREGSPPYKEQKAQEPAPADEQGGAK